MKNIVILISLLLSSSAFAGFYAGVDAGIIKDGLNAKNNIDNSYVVKPTRQPLTGRVFIGYDLNKYFGLEAGYLLATDQTLHQINMNGIDVNSIKVKEQIADVSGKARFYMGDKFNVFAKAGLAYDVNSVSSSSDVRHNKNIEFLYGAGLGYDLNQNVSISASLTRYNGNRDTAGDLINGKWKPNMDFYALSFTYKF